MRQDREHPLYHLDAETLLWTYAVLKIPDKMGLR
jgi:hypothetical protein